MISEMPHPAGYRQGATYWRLAFFLELDSYHDHERKRDHQFAVLASLSLRITKFSSPSAILRLLSCLNSKATFLWPFVRSGEKYTLEKSTLFFKDFDSFTPCAYLPYSLLKT